MLNYLTTMCRSYVEALWQHKHSFWVCITSYWDFPTVQNWEKCKQTKTFCHIIVFLDYCDSNDIKWTYKQKDLVKISLNPKEQSLEQWNYLKFHGKVRNGWQGDHGHKRWHGMARKGSAWCDACMTTCHKKQTFKDLISCVFHNLKINMAHVVKCSNGLREACNMLFFDMTLEDRGNWILK